MIVTVAFLAFPDNHLVTIMKGSSYSLRVMKSAKQFNKQQHHPTLTPLPQGGLLPLGQPAVGGLPAGPGGGSGGVVVGGGSSGATPPVLGVVGGTTGGVGEFLDTPTKVSKLPTQLLLSVPPLHVGEQAVVVGVSQGNFSSLHAALLEPGAWCTLSGDKFSLIHSLQQLGHEGKFGKVYGVVSFVFNGSIML